VEVVNGGAVLMEWEVSVLLDDDNTLSEEVFEDGSSVSFLNEDHDGLVIFNILNNNYD